MFIWVLKKYKGNKNFMIDRQHSVCGRDPALGSHTSQPTRRWVSTWMGDRRSAACISKSWAGGHFFRDCRLETDSVKWPTVSVQVFRSFPVPCARREFLREILYKNITIIAIQYSKIYFLDTFGQFSHTVEWNSLKYVWQISLYILA